jgi:hypothetical protein
MNDTMGPEGLVPTLLVFGSVPRLSIGDQLPSQNERMSAMKSARCEMYSIVSELRINRTLYSKTLCGAMRVFHPRELARVYRECPNMWTGPFAVVRVERKTVYVLDGIVEKPFAITSVKPHHTPRNISAQIMLTTYAVLHSLLHGFSLHTPIFPAANPVFSHTSYRGPHSYTPYSFLSALPRSERHRGTCTSRRMASCMHRITVRKGKRHGRILCSYN